MEGKKPSLTTLLSAGEAGRRRALPLLRHAEGHGHPRRGGDVHHEARVAARVAHAHRSEEDAGAGRTRAAGTDREGGGTHLQQGVSALGPPTQPRLVVGGWLDPSALTSKINTKMLLNNRMNKI